MLDNISSSFFPENLLFFLKSRKLLRLLIFSKKVINLWYPIITQSFCFFFKHFSCRKLPKCLKKLSISKRFNESGGWDKLSNPNTFYFVDGCIVSNFHHHSQFNRETACSLFLWFTSNSCGTHLNTKSVTSRRSILNITY